VKIRAGILPMLISFATGTLLGAACLGLLPKALSRMEPLQVMATTLAGLVVFFIIEKTVIWRHCHKPDCTVHSRAASLILLGDATHNFIDGIAIAVATMTSIPLGISTALAVTAHEIPQEVGDFAILMSGGFSRSRALRYNLLSSLAAIPGAVLAWYFDLAIRGLVPYVMAFSAASFLYIAVADLIPASHAPTAPQSQFLQVILMIAGIATVAAFVL
jgi:zinc and cadmium transporter